jgi:hypothetical protein
VDTRYGPFYSQLRPRSFSESCLWPIARVCAARM